MIERGARVVQELSDKRVEPHLERCGFATPLAPVIVRVELSRQRAGVRLVVADEFPLDRLQVFVCAREPVEDRFEGVVHEG
jgi:hypothetical protein